MKKIGNLAAIALSAVMLTTGAVACGTEKGGNKGALQIYIWNSDGSTPEGFTEVLNHFNQTYAPEL
ncbi:MAG: hypothetical protein K2J30_04580, partial [Clostridia bacterium]|nr:hypothetical protein [Clostridia bacterium]